MRRALAHRLVVQRLLKVQQLAHKGEVGRDVGLAPLDEVIGLVEAHGLLRHEVGDGDGDRAADSRQAVHQDSLLAAPRLVCNTRKATKPSTSWIQTIQAATDHFSSLSMRGEEENDNQRKTRENGRKILNTASNPYVNIATMK